MDFEERSEEMQEVAVPAEEIAEDESAETEEVADLPTDDEDEVVEEEDEEETSPSDSAFAEMRRRNKELEARVAELDSTLGLFFDGDNKVAQAKAHYEGITVEEAQAQIDEANAASTLKEENEELKEQLNALQYEKNKADDLQAIRKAHPEADIKDVEDLGEKFFSFRVMGIDAVDAYEAITLKAKNKPPKNMGKVKTSAPEKDYYTSEEVDAMSEAEVKKNFDKIRASMSKW